jgi:hypothetical protein
MVVSSSRAKMSMKKYKEVCMNILTLEDETTTLFQNIGHQLLIDLPPHSRKTEISAAPLQKHKSSHRTSPVTTKKFGK